MKKQLILALALIGLMSVFSLSFVSAQEEEEEVPVLPSCSPEDYAANVEALGEGFDSLGELTVLPEEPTPSDFSAVVATVDTFALGYWEGLDPEAIVCAEELYIARTAGIIFDEMVIVSALNALAVHEDAAGNAELAELLLGQATARAEALQTGMTSFGDLLTALVNGEEISLDVAYPECTEEELNASFEGMTEINDAYVELSAMLEEELTGADLSNVITGFAELSGGYWGEFYPVLPACAEVIYLGFNYGLILDESLIMVSLWRLAELETEAGNDELAQVLSDNAAIHAEYLSAMAEDLFGTEEEE
jgi:hypothetical protein